MVLRPVGELFRLIIVDLCVIIFFHFIHFLIPYFPSTVSLIYRYVTFTFFFFVNRSQISTLSMTMDTRRHWSLNTGTRRIVYCKATRNKPLSINLSTLSLSSSLSLFLSLYLQSPIIIRFPLYRVW